MSSGRRTTLIACAAVLTGVAIWGITACNRDSEPDFSPAAAMHQGDARIVTEEELPGLVEEVGHQIFWAGPQPGTQLEFSSDGVGNVHLRYLTDGAEAGEASQGFLNIGSYPFADAYAVTRNLGDGPGLVAVTEHGGVGFFDPANPFSVIIAWPEQPELQVEVYHPERDRALDVVRAGDIVPVS